MRWAQAVWGHVGSAFYNSVITYVPFHLVRRSALRLWGAKIGHRSTVLRGTTVLGMDRLVIGKECGIGFRCLLDARAGLTIGDRVVIASDTHFLAGEHDIRSPDFTAVFRPIVIGDYVWIASRATVECGVTLGRGAVVATCSLVRKDVAPLAVVAGVPAEVIGVRPDVMDYSPAWRPLFF